MSSCGLRLGALALEGRFLRCDRDGVWFSRDAMTALFARVSRRGGFRGRGAVGGGGGRSAGHGLDLGHAVDAMLSNMPSGHGGMSGALASMSGAFRGAGPASAGLAISHWQDRRPRVHTLFVSAHRDRRLGCPSCRGTALAYLGDRWACATCAGSFVENAALSAMIVEMAQKPWELPAVSGTPGDRACPICQAAMVFEVFEGVPVDRCGVHGVWFDDTELQAALQHASAEPPGLGAWLKTLFRRSGSAG
jgi:ribosomal protein S27AE